MRFTGEQGAEPTTSLEESNIDNIKRYTFAAGFVPEANVLDAGCGYGYGTSFLAKNTTGIVIGIDYSDSIISYANLHYYSDNLKFQVMDVTDLTFADNTFGVVVSFEVIEHLREPEKYLSEIFRVLKPGGIFILSTPNKKFRVRSDDDLPTWKWHVKEYFTDELHLLLSKYFSEVKMMGMHIVNPYFSAEQRAAERKMKSGLRGFLIRMLPVRIIRLVPLGLKTRLSGASNYLTSLNVSASSQLSLNDIVINEKEPDQARNIITVCIKTL